MFNTKFNQINKEKAYFIADIGSNHEGSFERAKELCRLVKEAGGHAVKFQHFKAENIVSDVGFKELGGKFSHQKNWDKSVFEIYKKYEYNRDWDDRLLELCNELELDYLSTPYDMEAVSSLEKKIDIIKIGSGDTSWIDIIEKVAKIRKPVLLATGATTLEEVENAVSIIKSNNCPLCLMQCNTNYTGSECNFDYVNLKVLSLYQKIFPDIILGLSDHTPGYSTVLGAISLGASVIEKHFTDDNLRNGPDHHFAMNPKSWALMVKESSRLCRALGDGVKRIENNEKESLIVQRRSICASSDLLAGTILTENMFDYLRPYPEDSFAPYEKNKLVGMTIRKSVKKGKPFLKDDLA